MFQALLSMLSQRADRTLLALLAVVLLGSNPALSAWQSSTYDGIASAWSDERGVYVSLGCNVRLGGALFYFTFAGEILGIPGLVFEQDAQSQAIVVLEASEGEQMRYPISVHYVAHERTFVGDAVEWDSDDLAMFARARTLLMTTASATTPALTVSMDGTATARDVFRRGCGI